MDVETIAKGLSEAQRRAIAALSEYWQIAPVSVTRQSIAALHHSLCERGWPRGRIINTTPVEYRLTVLGCQVRAALQESHDAS